MGTGRRCILFDFYPLSALDMVSKFLCLAVLCFQSPDLFSCFLLQRVFKEAKCIVFIVWLKLERHAVRSGKIRVARIQK